MIVPVGRRRLWLGLAVAVLSPALLSAVGAVAGFPRIAFPALLLLLVVVSAVWLGGFAVGLVAAAVSAAGLALFVFPPFGSLSGQNVWEAAILLLLFVATALVFARVLASAQNARAAAEAAEERFRLLLEGVRDYAIFMLDASGHVTSWNAGAEAITGYRAADILGEHVARIYAPEDVERGAPRESLSVAAMHGRVEAEGWRVRKDGSRYWAHTVVTALPDESGGLRGFAKVIRDTTDWKRAEEQLSHMALHDPLTGLPNRALVFDRLASTLASAERRRACTGLLFVDLDRFKHVNDRLGHDAGDAVLVAASARLQAVVRAGDTVGRLGGDEFAVICPDVEGAEEAHAVGERVREALHAPFSVRGREVAVGASVGVAVTAEVHKPPKELVAEADAAMYVAKDEGRNRVVPFDEPVRGLARARRELAAELRGALERGELTVVYQPQVELESERVAGAEALVRWHHPVRGPLEPETFLPVAEEIGLLDAIDGFVVADACRAARDWNRVPGRDPIVLSVNVSSPSLARPAFVDVVAAALGESGADPATVCLELTEAALLDRGPAVAPAVSRLKALTVRLALDDFGAGYSSLSHVAQLPLDVVKVDPSLVSGLASGSRAHAVVAAICGIARALDLRVVAVGVETADELAQLRDVGCDLAQGNHLSPPRTRAELEELLFESRGRDAVAL